MLITRGATYKEIYETFRWNVPERFNMAVACCDRWAAEGDRIALIHEASAGPARRYTFRDLQRASKRAGMISVPCSVLFGADGIQYRLGEPGAGSRERRSRRRPRFAVLKGPNRHPPQVTDEGLRWLRVRTAPAD